MNQCRNAPVARTLGEALTRAGAIAAVLLLVAGVPMRAGAVGRDIIGNPNVPGFTNTGVLDYLNINTSVVQGNVTNAAGGVIGAVPGGGLFIAAGTVNGALVNLGSVGMPGLAGPAVFVQNLTMSGGIQNAGTIQSGAQGILAEGGNLSGGIRNSGTLSARYGIELIADRFAGDIVNTGLLVGTDQGILVSMRGATPAAVSPVLGGAVINTGTLRAGRIGIGVAGPTSGGILNLGSIEVQGLPMTNATGTPTLGAGIMVLNSFWNPASGSAGGIVNSGSILSRGGDGIAVYASGFAGGIANAGTIWAPAGVGIRVVSGLTGPITNTGVIGGGVAAIDTRAATAPTVINLNDGAIAGDIALSPTFADTINAAAGTMTGNILATGPRDDQLNLGLNGGAFTLNGRVAGVSSVLVTGGVLNLNGDIANTTSVTTGAGGTLVLGAGSRVNPVSYGQAPTGSLAYILAADGGHGSVNAAAVTLAGTLQLLAPNRNGLYAPDLAATYANLMTWGTRSGQFSALDTGSIFLTGTLAYGPNALAAQVRRLPFNRVPATLTGNAYAVATGLEGAYPAAYGRMDAAAVAFYAPLFKASVGQYTQFLETAGGATYANTLHASLDQVREINAAVERRLNGDALAPGGAERAGARGPCGLWASLWGGWANAAGDRNAPGYKDDLGQLAVGGDYCLNPRTVVGVLAGYQGARIQFGTPGSTDVSTLQLGAYGQYETDQWYGNGIASVAFGDYLSKRRLSLPGGDALATGSYRGTAYVLYGEGGYRLRLGNTTIKPMLGLGYVNSATGAFTEDPGVYALRVQGATADAFTSSLGVRATLAHYAVGRLQITGEVRAMWQHEFLGDQESVQAGFAVLPGSDFRVRGTRYASDSAILGLGAAVQVAAHTEIALDYGAKLSNGYTANAVLLGVRATW